MVNTVPIMRMTFILSLITQQSYKFSAFPFSLHLMFDQTLSNLIVFLTISQKLHTKVAQMS